MWGLGNPRVKTQRHGKDRKGVHFSVEGLLFLPIPFVSMLPAMVSPWAATSKSPGSPCGRMAGDL